MAYPLFEYADIDLRLGLMVDVVVDDPQALNDPDYYDFFKEVIENPGSRYRMSQILREKSQNVADFFLALRIGKGAKKSGSKPVMGRELWAAYFPPPQWAIHNLISVGATLFGGKPKRGKSFIGMEMAYSVAYGATCFNQYVPIRGNVLYFALEDYAGRIHRRLHSMYEELRDGDFDIAWYFRDIPKISEGFCSFLEGEIDRIGNVKLVVIDTLRCIRDTNRNGSDLYQEDSDTIGVINTLGQDRDFGAVIAHHTRKAKADDIFEQFSGTLGLSGATSQNAILERSHGDVNALLYIEGKDLENELQIGLEQIKGGRFVFKGEGEQYRLGETTRKIRSKLIELDGLTANELATEMDMKYNTMHKHLKRLESSGIVLMDRNKIWRWEGLDGDVEI